MTEEEVSNLHFIDPAHFRDVLGNFVTGVTVITAPDGEEMVGISANSFTSVSLDPPLVGFCPAHTSTTYPRIRRAGKFCVNVLAEGQEQVARLFGKTGVDRFAEISWSYSPSGSAIINGCLAWIDCSIEKEYEAGDHLIVLGRVQALDLDTSASPLLFFRGRFAIERPE